MRSLCARKASEFTISDFKHIAFSFSEYLSAYLIFVIFFTQAKFLENKIYTENANFLPYICKKKNANFSR